MIRTVREQWDRDGFEIRTGSEHEFDKRIESGMETQKVK
jgi:hypothetical protein